MAKPKYKIQPCHIEERGGIARLERDGFTRQDISQALYKHTDGMGVTARDDRREIMHTLHDREQYYK